VNRSDASALADLQMHWDEAYEIGLDGDIWSARFRGATDELRAHTPSDLRELIRFDYSRRQQARTADDQDDDMGGSAATDDDDDDGDDEMPGEQPDQVDYAAIRGERMSI